MYAPKERQQGNAPLIALLNRRNDGEGVIAPPHDLTKYLQASNYSTESNKAQQVISCNA